MNDLTEATQSIFPMSEIGQAATSQWTTSRLALRRLQTYELSRPKKEEILWLTHFYAGWGPECSRHLLWQDDPALEAICFNLLWDESRNRLQILTYGIINMFKKCRVFYLMRFCFSVRNIYRQKRRRICKVVWRLEAFFSSPFNGTGNGDWQLNPYLAKKKEWKRMEREYKKYKNLKGSNDEGPKQDAKPLLKVRRADTTYLSPYVVQWTKKASKISMTH